MVVTIEWRLAKWRVRYDQRIHQARARSCVFLCINDMNDKLQMLSRFIIIGDQPYCAFNDIALKCVLALDRVNYPPLIAMK